ncbi:MAG: aminotransferase class III-fold pyridoxal phosphate-dependent enzyme [Pseudomonadota bacterium]
MDRKDRYINEITELAADLSGYAPADIAPDAGFLALGFDSLFLTQFAAAVQKEFGVKTTFRQLIEKTTTVSALAASLDAAASPDAVPAAPPEKADDGISQESMPGAAPSAPLVAASSAPTLNTNGARPAAMEGMAAVFAQQLELMQQQVALLTGRPLSTSTALAMEKLHKEEQSAPSTPSLTEIAGAQSNKPDGDALVDGEASATPLTGFGPSVVAADAALTPLQQEHIDDLINRYNNKTAKSKVQTDDHRAFFADPRTAAGFNPLWKEMVYPLVVEKSLGAHLWDIDGNQYVDLLNGFGPNFFGHRAPFIVDALKRQLDEGFEVGPQTPLAGEAARLFCELTGMARVSWVNTGSEAVQAAIRVARTVTGRDKIVAFAGSYHGNFDEVLYSRAPTAKGRKTRPMAPGVPTASVENVMVLEYGEASALKAIEDNVDDIAIVMVEPIQSRRPEFQPKAFLQKLRQLTKERGVVLLFDEVITGFRTGPGGAQAYFDVRADLATYGKVIGGGMPIGAIAGDAEFMDTFDGGQWRFGDASQPTAGVTFFAGTFVRHPLAIAAAHAALSYMKASGPALQAGVNAKTTRLAESLNAFFQERGVKFEVAHFASQMFFRTAGEGDLGTLFFYHLREKGVHILEGFPSYMTAAHTDEDVDAVIAAAKEAVLSMQADGLLPTPASAKPALQKRSFPLTTTQREMWIASQMSDKAACAFVESDTMEIVGPIDDARLTAAMADSANAIEAFKTVFDRDGEHQTIEPSITIGVNHIDLQGETGEAQTKALEAFFVGEAGRAFDLATGPLVRLHLINLEPDRRLLVVYASHLVFDGYSADLFVSDIIARYEEELASESENGDVADRPSIAPYRAFVHATQAEGRSSENEAYWRSVFKTPPTPIRLPTDRPHTDLRRYGGATVQTSFDEASLKRLRAYAAANGVSTASVATAAYIALLSKLSGDNTVIVGAPQAGQAAAGVNAVGCCVSMAPLRVTVDPTQTLASLAVSVQEAMLDAHDHLPVALGDLARALQAPRERSRPPIVQAVFNYSRFFGGRRMGEATVRAKENPRRATQYELFLNVREDLAALSIDWDFATDLYDAETIREWTAAYRQVLDEGCAGDSRAIGDDLKAVAEVTRPSVELGPETAFKGDETPFEAPNGPIETAIAAIFQALTGARRVGAFDNFFDLGGRSLHAVRALTRLRKDYAPALQLRDVFDADHVRSLAERIAALSETNADAAKDASSVFDEYEF